MPVGAGQRLAGIEQGDCQHHAEQQRAVERQAAKLSDEYVCSMSRRCRAMRFAFDRKRTDHQGSSTSKQQAVDEQPLFPQAQRPGEADALQIAEEQRRIADRQQAAAAIADDKDEEDDGVADVFAFVCWFPAADESAASPRRSCR